MQARSVLASQGCTCGCASFDLYPQGESPRSSANSPLPAEGVVYDNAGNEVGGLIVFVDDGLLVGSELYYYDDPEPLPPLDQVRWVIDPTR